MKHFAKPFVAVITAFVLLAAVAVALPQAQPAAANQSDGYALYTWSNDGITSTTNGAGRFTADYGQFECYQTVDETDLQTVTLKFQHSPNNSVWADGPTWQFSSNVLDADTDFADVTADGTSFGLVTLYGEYTRPVITLGEANPVTVTVRCIAKDTPGQDINQSAGAVEETD